MEKENNEVKESFDKAIDQAKNLKGGIDAFILIVKGREENDKGDSNGFCAAVGTNLELAKMYNAMPKEIKKTALMVSLTESISEIIEKD